MIPMEVLSSMERNSFDDNTISFGVENIYQPIARLKIIPGLSYNMRNSNQDLLLLKIVILTD